jgi:hypothetical protein
MKKNLLDLVRGRENNYLNLEEELLIYNQKNDTNYDITHNGLELWISLIDKPQKEIDEIIKIISKCGFKTPNFYGYKYIGHLLWFK